MSKLGEFERIAHISRLFASASRRRIKVGIGDDAAVLRAGSGDWVWTVDSSVEDVHFRLDWLSQRDIGWRSFQAAASDLAAMGASPVGALSALELPKSLSESALRRLLEGQQEAAKYLKCPIIGGNLSSGPVLAITTTVLGQSQNALLRSTAAVGDQIWLVGEVGLARAGLLCLLSEHRDKYHGQAVEHCVERWRRPEALLRRGRMLQGRAHAVIDISDGLVGDAEHISESSRVALAIDLQALEAALSPDLVEVAMLLRSSALTLALQGGEDYALLATGPREKRPRWAKVIGNVASGNGVWGVGRGKRRRLRRGFDHFS
ncbi:MAG TPA: thiamine-phosphate kinase [Polyangiaceae bacterium]|nr:thiamine-phosphate kinase [Polyangiaceae bacterium]